eukprot:2665030-Rhodomonas_salina.2
MRAESQQNVAGKAAGMSRKVPGFKSRGIASRHASGFKHQRRGYDTYGGGYAGLKPAAATLGTRSPPRVSAREAMTRQHAHMLFACN